MQVDPNNQEFNDAVNLVNRTNRNIFLTGKAGTGKTTFLKYIKKNSTKNIVVVAPTGIAAINAGGVTIHSFFQIPPSVFVPEDKRLRLKAPPSDSDKTTIYDNFKYSKAKKEVFKAIDLLIIDEVSMVRCDLLDVIDRILRVFGGGSQYQAFGGKQVLLIGDPFQLPPIAKNDAWNILGRFYKSRFFFNAQAFSAADLVFIELQKIYRQQNDRTFIDLLNRVRVGETSHEDISLLNAKVDPNLDFTVGNYIYLATHKRQVKQTNEDKLTALPGPLFSFTGTVTGKFPERDMPTARTLSLKENAQIMFVKNDSGEDRRYFNGLIAKVKTIDAERIIIVTKGNREIVIEKTTWEKIKYEWDAKEKKIIEKIEGTFTQYPVKLAWAITVHKSQGLTFERVYADLKDAFENGQVYVALSRCTALSGLKLVRPIDQYKITVAPEVIEFYELFLQKSKHQIETLFAPPKIDQFKASQLFVSNGETVSINWQTREATEVFLEPIGEMIGKNSIGIRPIKDAVYQLKAISELGRVTLSKPIKIQVSKEPPKIVSFTVDREYTFPDFPIRLDWEVLNASKITIEPLTEEIKPKGFSKTILNKDTDLVLIATSHYGYQSSKCIPIKVLPLPLIERLLVPEIEVEASVNLEIKIGQIPMGLVQGPNVNLSEIPEITLDPDLLSETNLCPKIRIPKTPKVLFHQLVASFENSIQSLINQLPKKKVK